MSYNTKATLRNVGLGLLALLAPFPLLYAQRSQFPGHGDGGFRGTSTPRSEPARAPAPHSEPAHASVQHNPVVVDRISHGSIRHAEDHVVERPIAMHRDFDAHQQVIIHHDRDVDINRPRYWHGFVYGSRRHELREGCLRLFVNGSPYFYDDGIFFRPEGGDYAAAYPPVGAVIPALPDGAIEIYAGGLAYYYGGGAFYVQQNGGFVIAPTPLGVIVPEPPPGAAMVLLNGSVVYQFNGVYFRPVFANGATQYQTFQP